MNPQETGAQIPPPRIGRSVSLDDAAELLGVSRRTIYNRIRRGSLETVRTIGGSQRVLLASIERTMRPAEALVSRAVARFAFVRVADSTGTRKPTDAISPSDRSHRGEHKEA